MTSTYDSLGNLLYEVRETPEIADLVARVVEYAIDEISKVNPKILNWDDWSKGKTHSVKFLGGVVNQVGAFLSDAHSLLDHTEKYHLRTVNGKLDLIISKLCDWFVRYKDRKHFYDRFYGLADFGKGTRNRYPKVFKELLHLVNIGVIEIPEENKRVRKRIAKW